MSATADSNPGPPTPIPKPASDSNQKPPATNPISAPKTSSDPKPPTLVTKPPSNTAEPAAKPEDPKPKTLTTATKLPECDVSGVTLTEDDFAQFYDEKGAKHIIKRFTWKNRNKIQVQVLSYGARVISVRLPDRKGEIEDVLLGFDDLAGYIFYDRFYFGAVIGRTSNVIKHGSFAVGNERYDVSANYLGKHCLNGGFKGLDKVVWDSYVTGKKVIMSHVSPHLEEGFPGDLLVRVSFELSAKNEFKVSFEAVTTQPTCVDLSHLLYFNMAGHYAGPEELYRHILTMNCNCFTPQVDKIPTGEIFNVLHSEFDFQVPKLLGKVMGITPKDGFDQNLCVNRGMYQEGCFVGRVLHPPSGRMLEVYSNQPGVRLNTANDFGYGILPCSFAQSPVKHPDDKMLDSTMLLYQKVHDKVLEVLNLDKQQSFVDIQMLIAKVEATNKQSWTKLKEQKFKVTPLQSDYLKKAKEIVCKNEETDDACLNLKSILSAILDNLDVVDQKTTAANNSNRSSKVNVATKPNPVSPATSNQSSKVTVPTKSNPVPPTNSDQATKVATPDKSNSAPAATSNQSSKVTVPPPNSDQASKVATAANPVQLATSNHSSKITVATKSSPVPPTTSNPSSKTILTMPSGKDTTAKSNSSNKLKFSTNKLNQIPVFYKDCNQIRGKERALYKAHGAIALQTQNYPNAVNVNQFPNCILNPGEMYRHDVVYRFWIRAGNPSRWIRRNLNETKMRTNNATKS